MVNKIFDFPGGTEPFVFSSDDPQVKAEVTQLRNKYVDDRNKMPINKIEEVMLSDETEDGFIRSFAFYFLSSILCPASYCFGNMKFLYSLRDVSAIPSLDFGQLALDFLREESERHFEMIMNRPSIEEMNKPSYIGGCLPIWGIIYVDFVDFDFIHNHQSTVDYSLPRISHVKSEDFKYLASVDRNYESRKNYGVLPLRDISCTPYANVVPVNSAPDAPGVFNSVPSVEVNNGNSMSEALIENKSIDSKNPDIISAVPSYTAKVEPDIKFKPEPHLKSEDPSNDVVKNEPIRPKFENISVLNSVYQTPIFPVNGTPLNTNPVEHPTTSLPKHEEIFLSTEAHDNNFSTGVDPKRSFILISSASPNERVKHFEGTPIIIQDDSPITPAGVTNEDIPASHCDTSVGISMNMDFVVQQDFSTMNNSEAGPSTGTNTMEKKNRKKRAAKVQSPEPAKKLKISHEVDIFFSKYLWKPIFQEYTLFVDIEGFPVSYENYLNSFKARGEIGDEVMNSFIQVLNHESKMSSEVKPYVKKYCFTSYFTNKFLVPLELFDPVSCMREFDRINSEESLWKQDLLYFPTIKSNHWVVLSINSLFEKCHFFYPCGTILGTTQQELVYNLVSNYNMLCKLSKKPFKNVFS
uniref:Ubiquitin-like protease family profile domain-containing protein n=1 Tax=Triticum urartu TaxID=4572 RepID=A0A8R7QSY8_TRIUA